MYQNAKEILRAKWNGGMNPDLNEHSAKDGWFFTAPIPASYYVDLVW